MAEKTINKNVGDDEIDLLDLFRRIGRTFKHWSKSLGRAFLITTVFLLKRWLPLGLSLIAAIGVSYLMKTTSASLYTSDLTLRSNTVATAEMLSYINRLHRFCVEDNSLALADALSVTPAAVDNIIDISAYWIIDKGNDGMPDYVDFFNDADLTDSLNVRMQDRLDIRVRIKSPQELSLLQKSLVTYIEKDSLFQQRNRVRLRQNLELLTRLDYDILQLDSLQKVLIFEQSRNRRPTNGGQMIFVTEQKTQLVYSDIYGLYSRKQALESDRDLYRDIVTILSDFSLPAKRDNGGFYYAKYLVPIFFFLTLLVLILLANRKKLEEVYFKY
jgi:hypothetical protein